MIKPRFHHDHDSESHCYIGPQDKAISIVKVNLQLLYMYTLPPNSSKKPLIKQSSVAATHGSK